MERKKYYQTNDIDKIIFYFAYICFFLKYLFDSSTLLQRPKIADSFLILVFLLLIAFKLILQEYTPSHLLIIGAIFAVIAYSCMKAKNNNIYLMSCLCVISMQNIDLKKIVKLSCILKSAALITHITSYILISALNPSSIQFYYRGEVTRASFFLGHANMFSFVLTWAIFEIIFLNYENLNIYHMLICWGVSIFFYFFTWTNTGIIIFSVVTFLILAEKCRPVFFERTAAQVVKFGYAVCSVFSISSAVFYPQMSEQVKNIWNSLNKFMSGRLLYGAFAYDVYGYTIFGRSINFPAKSFWKSHWIDTILFDNVYLAYFILSGVVNLVLISVIFFLIAEKTENKEKIFIIAFIFYGIMEVYVMTAVYCFVLLIIGKYIFNGKTQGEIKNVQR